MNGKWLPVTLDETELASAAKCGKRRFDYCVKRGHKQRGGIPGENENLRARLANDILGAAGEIAYAKKAERRWECKPETFGEGDDTGGVQVRTRSRAYYELMVRPTDKEQHAGQPFVLVTGTHGGSAFVIVGWIYCEEAQRDEWLRSYGGGKPAWFVPQSALHPFPLGSDRPSGDVCPNCGALGFRRLPLGTTELLVCDAGCTGRAIASALSLEGWPY